MIKDSSELKKKLRISFTDPELFTLALTHRSMGSKNNERLEYLGDSILGFVIARQLYLQFPQAGEGMLSRLRANLVNQSTLAELARQFKIGDYLRLGSGELKSGGYRRDSILSDAMEAIMGALLIDQGIEACETFILAIFDHKLQQLDADNWHKDAKTRLQELMQGKQMDLPEYSLINQSGAAHAQTFTVKCTTPYIETSSVAEGSSRKKAEQAAAEKMLDLIQASGL